MFKNGYVYFSFLLLFSGNAFSQSEKPISEIIWLQSSTPPFHLPAESERPGLCDNLTEQLISSIKGVKHTRLFMPQTRINKYINEGRNVCFPCVIYKKSNNKTYTYSKPTAIYPPFSIITTSNKVDMLTKMHGNPINLISLLSDKNFTYGQAKARQFSPQINTIIENTLNHSNVSLSWSSNNESGAVIDRLKHGYLDYSLDYPFIASYFNRQTLSEEIVSIPIANSNNILIQGAVGCATNAKNNFADQAIKKINSALKSTILQSKTYRQNQHYWLNEHITNFDQLYYNYVLNFDSLPTDAPIRIVDQKKGQP